MILFPGQLPLDLSEPFPLAHRGRLPLGSTRARRSDPGTSHDAGQEHDSSGRRAAEADLVERAVRQHPGLTSAELAAESVFLAKPLGQDVDSWRYTLARRLPELEEGGRVRAVSPSPAPRRPDRRVDVNLAPCAVSHKRAMRWWPS